MLIHPTNGQPNKEEMASLNERAKSGTRERVTEALGLGFTDEFDFSYEQCWPAM